MIWKVLRIVLGVALLPVVIAALHVVGRNLLGGVSSWGAGHAWQWLIYGAGVYVFADVCLHKTLLGKLLRPDPVRSLWGVITGYKPPPADGEGGGDGGGRKEERPANPFVVFAPYFFPLYTIIAAGVMIALVQFQVVRIPDALVCFIFGFTYMFHVFQVGTDLKRGHADITAGSLVLNVPLIVLANVQIIVLLLTWCLPDLINWFEFNRELLREGKQWWSHSWQWLRGLWQ